MKNVQLQDGRLMAYREAGSGAPLILIHGWSMSSAVFTEALEVLGNHFRVLAPDLRGHGESEGGGGYAFADFALDLEQWIAALDIDETDMLGWSLGGQVLLELYPLIRSRVRRMILTGTTPCFVANEEWEHGLPQGQVRAMERNLKRNYQKTMGDFFALQFAGEELLRSRYRRIIEFAVRAGRLPKYEVAFESLETLRLGDVRARLEGVGCPTLVLHGELDRITLPEAGRYIAEHISNAEWCLVKGVGHAPFLSRPEETFKRWLDFLS